jgi:prepilin signal peptidase PulO-like enzyme (type II secretory pathway)
VTVALHWAPLGAEGASGALRAYGTSADGVAGVAFGLVLLAVSLHDARTGEIPLRYTLGGSLAALAWAGLRMSPAAAGVRAFAAAGVALALWGLAHVVGRAAGREVMGEGDALLLAFLTLVVGPARVGTILAAAAALALAVFAARLLPSPSRVPGVLVATIVAAGAFMAGGWTRVGAMALSLAIVWPRRHRAAEPLAFGPMLAAGAALSLFTPAAFLPWLPHAAGLTAPLITVPSP